MTEMELAPPVEQDPPPDLALERKLARQAQHAEAERMRGE